MSRSAVAVDAKTVKTLRDATGAGMMDCKKALIESEGDMVRGLRPPLPLASLLTAPSLLPPLSPSGLALTPPCRLSPPSSLSPALQLRHPPPPPLPSPPTPPAALHPSRCAAGRRDRVPSEEGSRVGGEEVGPRHQGGHHRDVRPRLRRPTSRCEPRLSAPAARCVRLGTSTPAQSSASWSR